MFHHKFVTNSPFKGSMKTKLMINEVANILLNKTLMHI
jgi:hypothetical protein